MHLQPPLYFFSSHCLYAEKTTVELLQRPLFPGTATTAGFDSLTVLHDQLRRNIYKCVVQAGACDLHYDGIKELSEGKPTITNLKSSNSLFISFFINITTDIGYVHICCLSFPFAQTNRKHKYDLLINRNPGRQERNKISIKK